jgi:beta-glucanase (GH16 family)
MPDKFVTTIIIIFMAMAVRSQTPDPRKPDNNPPPNTTGDYTLVWHDEFNSSGRPDTANWQYEHGFVRNKELQWYSEANATCEDGVLLIRGLRQTIANNKFDAASKDWRINRQFATYTAASVNTAKKHTWLYGHFEIRARIDTAKGSWPAIWTLGVQDEWPKNGEIDIMEFYRVKDQPSLLANVAWGTQQQYVAKWNTKITSLRKFTSQDKDWVKKFHTWTMDWTADSIKLHLDGALMNQMAVSQTINADGGNPFTRPQYLLLNLAIGGNGGDPANTPMPIKYEVDYVRVYQKIK